MNIEDIKKAYAMTPHPEGGWYKELWQSQNTIGERSICSLTYYLLDKTGCCWHRLASDEIWLFHQGADLKLYLGGEGKSPKEEEAITLGKSCFHTVIPRGQWQRAETTGDFSLVSCVVAPGYREEDWEILN
ncbi:MAG: cupin domain-containing protein [Bacillota bacterium]|nr:cupin domain-containing protein [Bacillota bacterium]